MNKKTLEALEYNKIIELLLEKAESELARKKIRNIDILTNIREIDPLLEETDEALSLLIKRGSPPLYGIHDLSQELRRLRVGGHLTPKSLLKVADSLRVIRELKRYIEDDESDKFSNYPIIEREISRLQPNKKIEDAINQAIISEDEISDKASRNLGNIRRQIISRNNSIQEKLNSLINSPSYQKYLQDSIVTVREGRYVVPVKQRDRSNVPGLVHDVSSSGATAFIEPMPVVELNNELRELEIKEKEEIELILEELSMLVGERSKEIERNQRILQNLDFIFAKGKLALDMDATKPILNQKGYLNLKKARHPLLDKKEVVPIDVYLGKDFTSLVITGPNTGGKTVSLKTVGLLTLMAQSGLHIPVDFNSELAVFNQIFADIGDEQSIEQSLSTFSSHMTNIVDILENVESNSLLLFDELGAGTDPTEGAALAMSILDYLLKKDVRTIATTHYSQLKLYALTTEGVKNAAVEFDIESLKPTFRLSIGVPGKSNAFEISKRLGLEDYIIDYARELISQENIEFEEVLQTIEKDRKEIEDRRYEAEQKSQEVERLRKDLEAEREKTRNMRDKVLEQARREARSILRSAREESDLVISELKEISEDVGRERKRRIHQAESILRSKIDEVDQALADDVLNVQSNEPPKNLKIGETVEVLSLNQKGEVLSLPDEDGNLDVQVGIMKVNVDINTIRRSKAEREERDYFKGKTNLSSRSQTISNEIDLRGNNVEEAILRLDKYLDDAYMARLKEVSVIHGKGTGALRAGLQDYFRNHSNIKSYRLGKHGEGGSGVTILKL